MTNVKLSELIPHFDGNVSTIPDDQQKFFEPGSVDTAINGYRIVELAQPELLTTYQQKMGISVTEDKPILITPATDPTLPNALGQSTQKIYFQGKNDVGMVIRATVVTGPEQAPVVHYDALRFRPDILEKFMRDVNAYKQGGDTPIPTTSGF